MTITLVVIIVVTIFLGLFDVIMAAVFGGSSTISTVITTYSHKFLVIPFGFGFLMGHFFAQNSTPTHAHSAAVVIGAGASHLGRYLIQKLKDKNALFDQPTSKS